MVQCFNVILSQNYLFVYKLTFIPILTFRGNYHCDICIIFKSKTLIFTNDIIEEQHRWYKVAYQRVRVIYFYFTSAQACLVDDDADSCVLAVVSYDTWNWHNAGNNTPLQVAAQPNLTKYRRVILSLYPK